LPLHAVKLLGTLADPQALSQMVNELKQKPLHIIFPKPVRRLRAKTEYIDKAKTRSKALVGNLTEKQLIRTVE
jgi:hypothetical protein